MSQRLGKAQRQSIFYEMIELARFLTAEGIPPPKVHDAVKQLRDNLLQAYRQGITTITVDRRSYLESSKDREPAGESHETSF